MIKYLKAMFQLMFYSCHSPELGWHTEKIQAEWTSCNGLEAYHTCYVYGSSDKTHFVLGAKWSYPTLLIPSCLHSLTYERVLISSKLLQPVRRDCHE